MPHQYPIEAALRDERRVLLRPFGASDTDALYDFFKRLPESDRRFAWDRIEDRQTIERWSQNLDYDKVFPILAISGTRIIADATLHRREGGPLRLVGRLKWLIDPDFRGVGLGVLLVNRLIGIAQNMGLRHLTCLLISDLEAEAIRVLQKMGFTATSFPDYGTDPDGNQHDMTKMVLKL